MTTTLPPTLNTSSSSSAAVPAAKGAKTAQNSPGKPVSVHNRNERRTGHERHHGDPTWSAAFQAAIGRQPNGLPAPTPAAAHPASKGASKAVATISTVQGAGEQARTALNRGAGEALNTTDPNRTGKAGPRHRAPDAKIPAPQERLKIEATGTRPGTLTAAQSPAQDDQTQQGAGHASTDNVHKPLSTDASALENNAVNKTASGAGEHAPVTEIGHNESAQSVLGPSEPRPVLARPAIAQAAHPGKQPALSIQYPIQIEGRNQSSKPVSMSSLADGSIIASIQTATGPASPHAAPVAPAHHVSTAAPSQSLNPVSLQQLSAQIHILHQAGGGHAEIRLDPPSLGSVQIQLTLQQNQVQVSFYAAQAATAQMLQASLPQLTQAMQQQGITLTHTQVHASSDGGGVGPNPGGTGQQPGQQSGQQPENARVAVTPENIGNTSLPNDSENGVRAYA